MTGSMSKLFGEKVIIKETITWVINYKNSTKENNYSWVSQITYKNSGEGSRLIFYSTSKILTFKTYTQYFIFKNIIDFKS